MLKNHNMPSGAGKYCDTVLYYGMKVKKKCNKKVAAM